MSLPQIKDVTETQFGWFCCEGIAERVISFPSDYRSRQRSVKGRIAPVSVPCSHRTNAYNPFFKTSLCGINCLAERKRPCNSANLPNGLIPANTTGRFSFPDRIKSCRIKRLFTLQHPTVDFFFFLNKANFSGDCVGVLAPTTPSPKFKRPSKRLPGGFQQVLAQILQIVAKLNRVRLLW